MFLLLRFVLGSVLRLCLLGLLVFVLVQQAFGAARLKDIVNFEGVRTNLLVGYGIVVGLDGTGDTLRDAVFTRESLLGMLERLGVNARDANLRTDNVAAVMVTATLLPFARQGSRLDTSVSALGDATSLQGGTLLVTPLIGADGEVYAVAQGRVGVGALTGRQGSRRDAEERGVATSGRIADGAIVEREVEFDFAARSSLKLALRTPDFTTAKRIAAAVNGYIGGEVARALDPGTVEMSLVFSDNSSAVEIIADIEQLRITTDQPAKVVIDEHSGVIVMGSDVMIDEVAIAHKNLSIRVSSGESPAFPASPFASGEDLVDGFPPEAARPTAILQQSGVRLRRVVEGLNRLGTNPRDLIEILQAIKASGALKAELLIL